MIATTATFAESLVDLVAGDLALAQLPAVGDEVDWCARPYRVAAVAPIARRALLGVDRISLAGEPDRLVEVWVPAEDCRYVEF